MSNGGDDLLALALSLRTTADELAQGVGDPSVAADLMRDAAINLEQADHTFGYLARVNIERQKKYDVLRLLKEAGDSHHQTFHAGCRTDGPHSPPRRSPLGTR